MARGNARWSERELILNISEIFAEANSQLLVGIGDDAAVVSRPETSVVVTTDMAVEDVHFKVSWSSALEIGKKVASANLADIYAMGGTPKYLTVAMSATGTEELEWMLDIARGIAHEAHIAGAQVIGGDLSRAGKIVISITAIGECARPILRSGAQIGDSIYISSLPGWSAAGLQALNKNLRGGLLDFAIAEHRAPSVDYDNAEQIAVGANSLCDISDSLMIQGEQIADASGVCLEIDGDLITKHPDFAELLQVSELLKVSVFDLILSGGEDHCFLATGIGLDGFEIGKVLPGSGIRLRSVETPQPGWNHFN
jgi:thiamine-monophosphate kinase